MFNQTIVLGNLFQDPVIRYTNGGLPIVNLRIATNTYYFSEGHKKQKTESHDVFFTGAVAQNIEKYLKKGSLVFIVGEQSTSIQNDTVKGKIYYKNIKGHLIKFLDGKNKDHAFYDNDSSQHDNPAQEPAYNDCQSTTPNNPKSAPQPNCSQPQFAPDTDF